MSICIIHGTDPNIIKPFDQFLQHTAGEVLQELNFTGFALAYRNPFFTVVLKPEEKPLMLYPQLVINEAIGDYPPPEYYLTTVSIVEAKQYWIEVEVTTQLKDQLPLMAVPLPQADIPSLTAQDILLSCKTTFGYEFSDEKFTIGDEEISLDTPASQIVEKCKDKHLHLSMTVGDQGKRKIGARGHVTAEIISSEESYNNDLKMLEEFWEPEFRKCKAFEEKEVHSLFRDIKGIREVHVALLEDLKKIKPSFTCEMSFTFIKHLKNFVKATAFVSTFKTLDDMLKQKRSNRSMDKQISEIESRNPLQNGRNFSSYYITPVQRYPRYPLLFRELDKCTPNFHPEKKYIQYTFEKLNEVNKSIDSISHRVLQIKLMNDIQSLMPQGYLVIDHGREIIDQKNVRIVSKKSGAGVLYLFNNVILPCFAKKKLHTPIADFKPLEFSFANGKPTADSLFFEYNNETYQAVFQATDEKNDWMDLYRSVMKEQFKKINIQSPYITWKDVESPGVGERVGHDGCLSAGFVYFFGGTNESRQTTSLMLKYNIADSTWESENTPVPPRESHTVTSFRGDIYVCFGENPREHKVYDDIWVYSTTAKKWSKVEFKNEKPKPMYGHSCVVYDGKLFFFGGKVSEKKGEESLSNTISCFDPHTNLYSEIIAGNNPPQARFQHAALLTNKHEMVVLGGRANGFLGDVWVYNFLTSMWSIRSRAVIQERAELKAALIAERYIFVVGGLKEQSLDETCVIDAKAWSLIGIKQFGNVPPNLSKHAMVSLENNKAIIFGGMNRFTRRSYPSAWIFDANDQIQQFINASPSQPEEYWLKENQNSQSKLTRRSATIDSKSKAHIDNINIQPKAKEQEPSHLAPIPKLPPKEKPQKQEEPKIKLEEKSDSSGFFSIFKRKPAKHSPSPPPQTLPQKKEVEKEEKKPAEVVTPKKQPIGPTLEELSNASSRLRRKTIQPNAPKLCPEEKFDRTHWKASGTKFSSETMCKELGIVIDKSKIFEARTTERRMQSLWQKNHDNNELVAKIEKMERFIRGNFMPPKGTSFLLKVFDDASRITKITKIDASISFSDIVKKVSDILMLKRDPILSIAVSNGEQRSLDEKSLKDALCCVYKGEMRCLTINAL